MTNYTYTLHNCKINSSFDVTIRKVKRSEKYEVYMEGICFYYGSLEGATFTAKNIQNQGRFVTKWVKAYLEKKLHRNSKVETNHYLRGTGQIIRL